MPLILFYLLKHRVKKQLQFRFYQPEKELLQKMTLLDPGKRIMAIEILELLKNISGENWQNLKYFQNINKNNLCWTITFKTSIKKSKNSRLLQLREKKKFIPKQRNNIRNILFNFKFMSIYLMNYRNKHEIKNSQELRNKQKNFIVNFQKFLVTLEEAIQRLIVFVQPQNIYFQPSQYENILKQTKEEELKQTFECNAQKNINIKRFYKLKQKLEGLLEYFLEQLQNRNKKLQSCQQFHLGSIQQLISSSKEFYCKFLVQLCHVQMFLAFKFKRSIQLAEICSLMKLIFQDLGMFFFLNDFQITTRNDIAGYFELLNQYLQYFNQIKKLNQNNDEIEQTLFFKQQITMYTLQIIREDFFHKLFLKTQRIINIKIVKRILGIQIKIIQLSELESFIQNQQKQIIFKANESQKLKEQEKLLLLQNEFQETLSNVSKGMKSVSINFWLHNENNQEQLRMELLKQRNQSLFIQNFKSLLQQKQQRRKLLIIYKTYHFNIKQSYLKFYRNQNQKQKVFESEKLLNLINSEVYKSKFILDKNILFFNDIQYLEAKVKENKIKIEEKFPDMKNRNQVRLRGQLRDQQIVKSILEIVTPLNLNIFPLLDKSGFMKPYLQQF